MACTVPGAGSGANPNATAVSSAAPAIRTEGDDWSGCFMTIHLRVLSGNVPVDHLPQHGRGDGAGVSAPLGRCYTRKPVRHHDPALNFGDRAASHMTRSS